MATDGRRSAETLQECREALRQEAASTLSIPVEIFRPLINGLFFAAIGLPAREGMLLIADTSQAALLHILFGGMVCVFLTVSATDDDGDSDSGGEELPPVRFSMAAKILSMNEPSVGRVNVACKNNGASSVNLAAPSCKVRVNPDEVPEGHTPAVAVVAHEVGHYANHRWLRATHFLLPLPVLLATPLLSLPMALGATIGTSFVVWMGVAAAFRKAEYEADEYIAERTALSRETAAKALTATLTPTPALERPIIGRLLELLVLHPSPQRRIEALLKDR